MSGFGRGKVILLGEHAVVYGVPALAAGLERGVTATATPAAETELACAPWGTSDGLDADTDLGRALRAVIEAHPDAPLPPVRVEADVALPAGAGLGCSAALGVAVLRALDELAGRAASDAEIAERSMIWERVFHGNPSGLDNTMAAHGGVACFRRGEPLERLDVRAPLRLVIGDSGESSSTRAMVEQVARQRERDAARFDKSLDAIGTLVSNARLALEAGDAHALGQLMDLNQHLLAAWMLSTTALEDMIGAARAAGAKGAKVTGSGGGGCMIALVESEEVGAKVVDAIEALGFAAFQTEAG
ncbi:MAG: mevalonate kinase [Sandaracinaceae bacterium]|nr:mevalonate kinase [Sandaracinaceae bacterium]